MSEQERQIHPIPPVFDQNSRILILGSFPSVRSRAAGFYYGHPQNRFWRMLEGVYREPVPTDTDGKIRFLLSHGIALWDVIASCRIAGSADAQIRDVLPNDLSLIFRTAPIRAVCLNGKAAYRHYLRYAPPKSPLPAFCLPSTSPANAGTTLPDLIFAWGAVLGEINPTAAPSAEAP